jgi:hypothetical protein
VRTADTGHAPAVVASERRLSGAMRALLYVGGGFVLVAGFQLWVLADRTDDVFAWTIRSELTAAYLGSFYWAAAVLALLSAREPTWARARLGVPGVLAFVWLTLLATLLHLDLFHLDGPGVAAQAAGWIWLAVYVAEPPLLLWAFVAQLRAPGTDAPRPNPLPRPYRAALAVQAAILILLGAALFVAPRDVGDVWPWALTELTGRAIAAWLIAVGGLLAAIRWENDRGRIRLGLALIFTLVVLQALALVRFGDEIAWSQLEAAVLVAFTATLLASALAGWRMSTG